MAETKKRCLYEILNLPRDCSQEEIRSAYRRLALQLHPDKSPNSSPAAFQELQHAYETLSDPKERQFYDSHRSQILFSNPVSSSSYSSSSLFDLDLFSFFSTTAFSGFGDTGKGFFKVYGDVFSKIYAQELLFVKELGLDQDPVRPAPLIGNLESPYSQVTTFYNYWLGFVTVLDFAWVDEYAASLGVNRRSRRAMEEENKKKRKKARKEYNELVRDLAAFVKKRDKRVKDMQLKKSLEEEKRREEEKKRKKEEERKKLERVRMYEEPEWAKIDSEEEDVVFDEDEMGKKKEEFYCVVCNKKFKSDKQWKNHEQSKKHRDKVAELRVSFQEEEEEEEDEDFESLDDGETEKMEDGNVVDELCEEFKEDLELEGEQAEHGDVVDVEDEEEEVGSDDEACILEAMVSGHKSKKSEKMGCIELVNDHGVYHKNDEKVSTGYDSRKGRRNRAARKGTDGDGDAELLKEQTAESRDSVSDVRNQEEIVEEAKVDESQSHSENVKEHIEEASVSDEGVGSKGMGDKGAGKKHKKQVDARGPTKKDSKVSKSSSKGKKQKGVTKAPNNSCEICGESFDTRNKLFAHLGTTGHAALKSKSR